MIRKYENFRGSPTTPTYFKGVKGVEGIQEPIDFMAGYGYEPMSDKNTTMVFRLDKFSVGRIAKIDEVSELMKAYAEYAVKSTNKKNNNND